MYLYGGRLLHRAHDDLGVIEVVEDAQTRSLHFGSDPRQSTMLQSDPNALALSYTRAMSAALLLAQAPQRALIIGLGGGSLAKFLLHHLPHCEIDAVEFRPEVHRIACEWFGLPDDEPRLHLFYEDAGHFVRNAAAEQGNYDLILVDAFLERGISYSVCGMSFFDACRDRLAEDGVFSMNLWSDDKIHANDFIEDMGSSFGKQVLRLPVEGKANVIGLATRQKGLKRRLRRLGDLACDWETRTGVEYVRLLNQLRKHNRWLF